MLPIISNYNKSLCVLLLFILTIASCDNTPPEEPTDNDFSTGILIPNEGIFNQTSGTVSHFDPETKTVTQKIFKTTNNRDLGNVVQSIAEQNGKTYIVVNNSNKIEVVDMMTFESLATITGLEQPRYCLPISNDYAYVSQWGSDGITGSIAVVNLETNEVEQTITTAKGPEQLLWVNDEIWVVCKGGYDIDNKIEIIDINTNTITHSITVGDVPNSLVQGVDQHIWVACSGQTVYTQYPEVDTVNSTASKLIKIDKDQKLILEEKNYEKGMSVNNLLVSNDGLNLFFSYKGEVWSMDISTGDSNAIFAGNYYGLGLENTESLLYAARYEGINNAYVFRYQTNGVLVDSFQVGVFANGFVFR